MGKLVGYKIVGIAASYHFGVVGEAMQVLVVIGERQRVSLTEKVVPEEGDIHVGKLVRDVGHPCSVGEVRRGRAQLHLLPVAYIHTGEVAAHTEPIAEPIPQREVVALRLYLAIVDIGRALFSSAQVGDVALDVVFRMTIDQSALDIERMPPEGLVIAHIEIEVMAVLRPYGEVAHLKVLVAEHLFDSREAVCLLVRELRLKLLHNVIGTGGAIAPRASRPVDRHIFRGIVVGRHRTGNVLPVIFSKNIQVPFIGRLKFLFNGKIELQYLREWDSRTTVTSTDISMFRTIEGSLTPFAKVQLHDVKNSLTSFRVAATFLKLMKSNNQDFNIREAADLLASMEGYDLYDIGDNRYVRFNQKAYLSNYKRNDISMSVLDLYCIQVGHYPPDSFDYLKKLNSMQSLFDVPTMQGKTLEDIYFSSNSPETEQRPDAGNKQNDRSIKLYDVLCAYVSEQ